MSKIKNCIYILFFASQFVFAQQVELKEWTFSIGGASSMVTLPHTWNAEDAFDDVPGYYRGDGVYKKNINIEDLSKVYFLHFEGANQKMELYVNGTKVGEHKGGYTAFNFDISAALTKGKNIIKVIVTNAHDGTIPPLDADFTFYGGLYRKVFLEIENSLFFSKNYGADVVKIDPIITANKEGKISFTVKVTNSNSPSKTFSLATNISTNNKLDRPLTDVRELKVSQSDTLIDWELNIRTPELWSPNHPYLYQVVLKLYDDRGKLMDSYSHHIGFRTISISTDGFLINGEKLKLLGVNRHQDLETLGNAVDSDIQVQDLIKIKEMGSNFLRLAHYPQVKEIYRAADSLGLILWSEIPVVNKVPSNKDYMEFKATSLRMQQEHIAQNYNHPSLVFLGYMNEIFLRMVFDKPEKKEADQIIANTMELAQELEILTRRLAPRHVTVMALHGDPIYNVTGISDLSMVIGWNLYYGWYLGMPEDLGAFLDDEHSLYPDKPLILSEYGVGTDDRIHSLDPLKYDFSEEYQLLYHQGYWNQIHDRSFMIGMTAWNYADFGSEFRGDPQPHVNQKGLVNFNRTPKNIYYWYRTMMKPEEGFLKIFRDFPLLVQPDSTHVARVMGNVEVLLKINGKELGKKVPKNGIAAYDVKLIPGDNLLEATSLDGKLKDTMTVVWKTPKILVKGDYLAFNLGTEAYFKESNQKLWIPITTSQKYFRIQGLPAISKTAANIKKTISDPIFQSSLSGLEQIELKVPNGTYQIDFLATNLKPQKALSYELKMDRAANGVSNSNLTLLINNEYEVHLTNMPLLENSVYTKMIKVTNETILITNKSSTSFALNGLSIEKIK
ncbi:hypothetical protein OO010_14090 [Flavobacteriaceae bacterium KMM 6898]|nr:hypothetical protein [Flavobacteriaceae bacterium KMM 6898]